MLLTFIIVSLYLTEPSVANAGIAEDSNCSASRIHAQWNIYGINIYYKFTAIEKQKAYNRNKNLKLHSIIFLCDMQ